MRHLSWSASPTVVPAGGLLFQPRQRVGRLFCLLHRSDSTQLLLERWSSQSDFCRGLGRRKGSAPSARTQETFAVDPASKRPCATTDSSSHGPCPAFAFGEGPCSAIPKVSVFFCSCLPLASRSPFSVCFVRRVGSCIGISVGKAPSSSSRRVPLD